MTSPFPLTDVTCGFNTPVGSSDSLNVLSPQTTVCPAFAPPLYRTTKSWPSARRSTIFPFASSPHCNPTTHVADMGHSFDADGNPGERYGVSGGCQGER